MNKDYEMMTIFTPELEEDVLEKEIEKLKNYISSKEGEIKKVDLWGKRKLAYEIKKKKEGIYAVTNFKLSPAEILNFKRNLKLNENIIRFLIVKDE